MWLLLSWLLATALPADAVAVLNSAPSVTVYSLGDRATPRAQLDQKKSFHGYVIRNRVNITGEEKIAILGKLYTSIAENPGPARCFIPRHGIRAVVNDRTVDLVICFECRRLRSYVDNKEGSAPVGTSAEKDFTRLFGKKRTPT